MCEIQLGGQAIGQAEIVKEGLYYRFTCRCRLSGEVVYRLQARCGEMTENLGIPVPEGKDFVLRTRLPIKRLGEGSITVIATPKEAGLEGKFVPLSPEEPFQYLRRLQNAYLQTRCGQVGVVLSDSAGGSGVG